MVRRSTRRRGRFTQYIDPVTTLVKNHFAVHEREQRPIPSRADILAGDKLRAALADQDAAGGDELTAKSFNSKPLADAVAPIADTALTFFVCHKFFLRRG